MAWCSAYKCNNSSKTTTDKSFFNIPKDRVTRESWIKAINRTELPSKVLLCSDHFTEECFDASWKLQNELYYKNRRVKKRLVPGSIPTIFPHKEPHKERTTSTNRLAKKKRLADIENALTSASSSTLEIEELPGQDSPESESAAMFSICTQTLKYTKEAFTQYKDLTVKSICTQTTNEMVADAQTQTVRQDEEVACQTVDEDNDPDLSSDETSDDCYSEEIDEDTFIPVQNSMVLSHPEGVKNILDVLGFSLTTSVPSVGDDAPVTSFQDTHADIATCSVSDDLEDTDTDEDEWLQQSLEREERNDPVFTLPSTDNESEHDETGYDDCESFHIRKTSVGKQAVYIIYESCLQELLRYCINCGGAIDASLTQELKNTGSQLTARFHCFKGCDYTWSTQPKLECTKGVGNLLLTAATELSGIGFNKISKFANQLNLKFISKTMYYEHRGNFVFPEIDHAWRKDQQSQIDEIIDSGRNLELALDGQCDTPGHNATYSTVSAMDCETNKVLNFRIVHVKEVTSSQAMEKEGFIRCVDDLHDRFSLPIRVISTDRHASIKKLMRTDPKYKDILHQFDPWHVGKGLIKKLLKASKKAALKSLAKWAPAVVNHMYWSIATCNGNGKELVERFTSIVHHSVNKHTFPINTYYKKCDHEKLTVEEKSKKEWLVMGSEAHQKLIKIVTQPILVKDMEKMNESVHTTMLEVFHAVKIRYLPKSIFFNMEKMIAGTQLAILDHNNNVNREQKYSTDEEGTRKPMFVIAYSKPNKRYVAKPVKTDKTTEYLTYIRTKILKRAQIRKKASKRNRLKRQLPLNIAPDEKPPREEIIEKSTKYKRLKL